MWLFLFLRPEVNFDFVFSVKASLTSHHHLCGNLVKEHPPPSMPPGQSRTSACVLTPSAKTTTPTTCATNAHEKSNIEPPCVYASQPLTCRAVEALEFVAEEADDATSAVCCESRQPPVCRRQRQRQRQRHTHTHTHKKAKKGKKTQMLGVP